MNFAQESDQVLGQFDGVGWEEWAIAAGILVVGFVIARVLARLVRRTLHSTAATATITLILSRLTAAVVLFIAFNLAVQELGVSIGPLIGALGIAGLALAFAFQDILENLIAGFLMLIRRPIAVGDEIVTEGYLGRVDDIALRALEMTTLDGETVYIPNATVWKNPVTNITARPDRRTTLEVGVSYDADLDRAKEVLEHAVAGVEGVHPTPAPAAFVFGFGASSIDFAVRWWHDAPTADMWRIRDEVARAIKRALDEAGIEIPFPQRVLHTAEPVSVEDP